ncbi:MAG: outer-membrane lipoprotein carrier protein LolA [Muribaculaceae bacterium]|nr:outer-membrane lipoprotein carrier protein LolA [Muribaculaceae bacterium]
MKKIFALFALALCAGFVAHAQKPQQMLDKAIAALKSAGTVTANYSVTSSQGNNSGSIVMSGSRYRLTSADVKCWFDGKTQWTYSSATEEVNITTPTTTELQQTNPYAAAQDFKKNYYMWKAAGQVPGDYAIMLQPRQKGGGVEKVYLYINNTTALLHKMHVKLADGNAYTVTLTNYKTRQNLPAGTFTFDKNQVPTGTQVVDLR